MNPEQPEREPRRAEASTPPSHADAFHPPSAITQRRKHFSPLWLVPLLAAGLVAYLGYRAFAAHGPTITVTFETADGLRVEQTQVKHKAVPLGTVQRIELSEGADHVIVHIAMDARAEPMLTEHANFWVVRPRLQGGGIAALQTGLETLVSGPYIELDPSMIRGEPKQHFEGLEQPPAVRSGEPGTTIVLKAHEIGAIGAGSVIMHRQVPVGEVIGFELDDKTDDVSLRAFVRAPYDRVIVPQTVFWNLSGLDVRMGASGLHVEVASMRTMISGGIAFRTPPLYADAAPVASGHAFPLFPSEAAAEIVLYGEAVPYVAYFHGSVQGLAEGSPVDMYGMQVGNVTDLSLVLDPHAEHSGRLVARVGFVLQPQRALGERASPVLYPDQMREQVAAGLRVVLETSNYVTGEKALSLSYMPDTEAGALRAEGPAWVLPSHARGIDNLTDALSDVAARLNEIPYAQIGRTLNQTLASIDRTVGGPKLERAIDELASTLAEVHQLAQEARLGLAPTLARLPAIAAHVDEAVASASEALSSVGSEDGSLQRQAQRMLTQVSEMARSVRLLADFLERHPEALLRGREDEEAP